MAVTVTPPAIRAIDAVLALLSDAGIPATRDAGAFHYDPAGVLVGLPELTGRLMGARTFTIPVHVVSGEPLTGPRPVNRLFAWADDIAAALSCATYRPTSWQSSSNAEPLPAILLTVTVTVTETEEP